MKIDLNAVKRNLEMLKCSDHNEKAKISTSNDNISFSCCCDKFKKKLELKTKELLQIESRKMIENEMKKLFKK
jgi:hypothetical protein